MGFRLDEYVALRPYTYHVSLSDNLPHIRLSHRLFSARELLRRAGRLDLVGTKRGGPLALSIDGHAVTVRDQDRLKLGSLELPQDLPLEGYVAYLNQWVYCWPGDSRGPAGRAKGLFKATPEEHGLVLRVPTQPLFDANQPRVPMFAAFNSGAARHHSGRPAKRDLKAHRASGLFRGSPADVVELVWEDELVLPTATQVGRTPSGPWLPLFPTAA